jgi:hypothetical protein
MHVSRILSQTLRFLREKSQTDAPRGTGSRGADLA